MEPTDNMTITVTKDGPYQVSGPVPMARQTIVTDREGNSIDWRQGEEFETLDSYALCRCGQSANKPYCDGSHKRIGFSAD